MAKDAVIQKARDVNRISQNYHLTHAVFACNELLKEEYKKEHKAELDRLNEQLKEIYRKEDRIKQEALLKEIHSVKQKVKYYIYVEYVKMPVKENRVIKTERQLIVSLSEELLDSARNKDGSFNTDELKKLRWVTAHELGHALLHHKDMKTGALQGSKTLSDDAESEAEQFAKELIKLRHDRNENLYKSKAY